MQKSKHKVRFQKISINFDIYLNKINFLRPKTQKKCIGYILLNVMYAYFSLRITIIFVNIF